MSFDPVSYLLGKQAGGGSSVTVEALTVTENGTTTAPTGKAYSPVTVDVDAPPEAEDKDINFYDLDGVRLFSYTRDEFAALSALPTAPDRPDLFLNFDGWNWTKAEIDAQPGPVEVGATYQPTDSDFALVVEPTVEAQRTAYFRFWCGNGNTVEVDWGDGSTPDEYTPSGNTQTVATHTWPALMRRYRIRLTRKAGESKVNFGGASTQIVYGENTGLQVAPVHEMYFGANCRNDGATITGPARLDRITFPKNFEKKSGFYFIGQCVALPRDSVNHGVGTVNTYTYGSVFVAGDSTSGFAGTDYFRNVGNRKITIPYGTTTLGMRCLSGVLFIKELHLPASVTNINANSIINEVNLFELWLHPTTPPTLEASSSITITASTIIFVPFSALAAYLTGTNYPSTDSYTYIGFATYSDGAALPTADATSAYNVTWYASKEDAANGTNAITTGNGKQIYCTWEAVS